MPLSLREREFADMVAPLERGVAARQGLFLLPRSEQHHGKLTEPKLSYTVREKRATSNEYFTAQALEHLNLPFLFQVYFWGGQSLRGGQVLDFLVYAPLPTPVQVFGDYWHEGQLASQDRKKIADLEHFLGRQLIILFDKETESFDAALEAVRRKVLGG